MIMRNLSVIVRILFRKFQSLDCYKKMVSKSLLESYLESFKVIPHKQSIRAISRLESYLESFKVSMCCFLIRSDSVRILFRKFQSNPFFKAFSLLQIVRILFRKFQSKNKFAIRINSSRVRILFRKFQSHIQLIL